MQFGRKLGLPQNMKCSGVKGNVLMGSHSHRKLSHQIDYSTSPYPSSMQFNMSPFPLQMLPGKKILNWINHQSIESSISFWVGLEFPTIIVCVAFHLTPLKDSYANNDKYGSIRDDKLIGLVISTFLRIVREFGDMQGNSEIGKGIRSISVIICGLIIMLRFHVKSNIGQVEMENMRL
ncbi:hypothetical protein CFP56_005486 [Quercus suber]|uniref:Uncharacterized protein n=1 Tax=Quercus suber TaxID=58331 RepID=A0AAW0IGS0_QUESU